MPDDKKTEIQTTFTPTKVDGAEWLTVCASIVVARGGYWNVEDSDLGDAGMVAALLEAE